MTSQSPVEVYGETIGSILREPKLQLRVPINQRSYAWKKEHVTDLYSDIAAAIADGRPEYFLGSIVVVRTDEAVEVYDGQQRIATSMILIAAIRDYFLKSGDNETASLIERESLFSKHRKTHEETAHFRLNAEDHDFFYRRVILRRDHPDRAAAKKGQQKESHKRIDDAASLAAERVEDIVKVLPEDNKGKQLHRWLDFLENGAQVIWVQVQDEKTAFNIFETMNDRGLRLSSADLLKNKIYAMAEDRKQEAIHKWQSMCAVLESIEGEEEGIVDYIRFFWIVGHGETRSKDLYDDIRKETTNKTKAVSLATALEVSAHQYAAALMSSHESWAHYGPGMRNKVATLRLLGVSQVRPLLLAALMKFPDKQIARVFDLCICWSVRCLIAGVPSGTLEGHYARNAHRIHLGTITDVDSLTDAMVKIVPDDERFRAAAAVAIVAKEAVSRYYLRVLQLQSDGNNEPQYVPNDGNEVTLEHVLPKKPAKGWEHFGTDEVRAYLNRLGNQVLLAGTVNSRIGNVGYDEKRAALSASEFSLTQAAANCAAWGAKEIAERQEKLADLAVKAWPIRR